MREQKLATILINATLNTAQACDLVIHRNGKIKRKRAQVHTCLVSPMATGKSTILGAIPDEFKCQLHSYTYPSVAGTIRKDGDITESALKESAGKVLVVDEAQNINNKAKEILLPLLDRQKHTRVLGWEVKTKFPPSRNYIPKKSRKHATDLFNNKEIPGYKKDKILYKFKVRKNIVDINARFSMLYSGTSIPIHHLKDVKQALLSRFAMCKTMFSKKDIYELQRGNKQIKIKKDKKPYIGPIEVPEDVYAEYIDEHEKITDDSSFCDFFKEDKVGYVGRNVDDILRIAAWFTHKDGCSTMKHKHIEKTLPLVKEMLFNYLDSKLTDTEYEIIKLNRENEYTEKEIGEIVNRSQQAVSKKLDKFDKKGLLNYERRK